MRTNQRHRSEIDTDRAAAGISLGPLAGYVGFMLRRIQSSVFSEFIASLGELDLRPAQYTLLEVIDANPGLRQSDAATALGIQKANFVALVQELERRTLIERRRSTADRRCYSLHLQTRGRRLLEAARDRHDAQESRLGALLGPQDREQLLALLNRLADMS